MIVVCPTLHPLEPVKLNLTLQGPHRLSHPSPQCPQPCIGLELAASIHGCSAVNSHPRQVVHIHANVHQPIL